MLEQQNGDVPFEDKVENFKASCRAAGLKLTHQRLEIFQELARATDHPTAESLHKRLQQKMPTLSLDTIYRTLSSLEQHGLICRVDTMESQARFETRSWQHHHLICTRCKEIIDFQWEAFDRSDLPAEVEGWGQLNSKNVSLHGICKKCLAAEQAGLQRCY